MAYRKHYPLTVSSSSNTTPHRTKPLPRRALASRKPSTSSNSSCDDRQALVPLINLRRLPSRTYLRDASEMTDSDQHSARIGTKRKRGASSNENVRYDSRATRGSRRAKRHKRSGGSVNDSSDEDASSGMEVDASSSRDVSSGEEENADTDDDESTAEYQINSAPANQLQRLLKEDLVRLYTLAGLTDDPHLFTKSELVDCIVAARDELTSLPPSSPPGRGSDCSSDDGQGLDSEEEETLPDLSRPQPSKGNLLRRRAMTNNITSGGPAFGKRSYSLGNVLTGSARKSSRRSPVESGRKRTSSRPSPIRSTSSSVTLLNTPLVNRLRSRKLSAPETQLTSMSIPVARKSSRSSAKSVDFAVGSPMALEDDSDLTELDSDTEGVDPSPRRLRSQDREMGPASRSEEGSRRVTPKRKAKDRITNLAEEDTDDTLDDSDEEAEVDQLMSSASMSTPTARSQQTPMKHRLRSRSANSEDNGSEADAEEDDMDDSPTVVATPRRLRNGKIVGEDEEVDDEDLADDDEDVVEDVEDADSSAEIDEVEGSLDDDEQEDEEEAEEEMEEDIDLTNATVKSLTRLRRENLVELCETRELDVSGTKPQLAASLLKWRDQREPPSSTGTVRAPDTVRRPRTRASSEKERTPVLMRSHVHLDEPLTPLPPSDQRREVNVELELDLEELGLNDREISPDKLTKLEKIGSGGFKDVFIGKLRGRKIAISEFRGQLSEMDIKELKLLGVFKHPNIVKFIGVSIPENNKDTPVMIVSELCTNGDLFDYVRNVNPPRLSKILQIMLDIAKGLYYLHSQNPSIIHRDCKSSNILIDAKGNAKIADFGLARVKQSTRSAIQSLVGTVNWQAPELWHAHPQYNHKVDVFSAAMVYWEMMQWHLPNKEYPWEGMNEHAIYEEVGTKRLRPSVVGLREQYCPEVVDLMESMWAHDHNDRPNMDEVVKTLEGLVHHFK